MNSSVSCIVGLGFGDEGKGSCVDYIARKTGASLVVRFSGGAQAAHGVVCDDGRKHVFSQFGSGTFAGSSTLLSRHMMVNPLFLMEEGRDLQTKGVSDSFDRMYIEEGALVTNPFQVAANRLRELHRNQNRHGSCGMGIGETGADLAAYGERVLRVRDLKDATLLREKLRFSRECKVKELESLVASLSRTAQIDREWGLINDEGAVDACIRRYSEFLSLVHVVYASYLRSALKEPGDIIFEGSQGVLLDKTYGFFPYVTRSDTTFRNAEDLLEGHPYTRIGVVRTYATRHGAGPFVTEDKSLAYPETFNGYGPWQQSFRLGHFDLVATEYAVRAVGGVDQIAMTHLDVPASKACVLYRRKEPPLSAAPITVEDMLHEVGVEASPSQELLTKTLLLDASPVYMRVRDIVDLVSDTLAPVSIISRGPAAKNKEYSSSLHPSYS